MLVQRARLPDIPKVAGEGLDTMCELVGNYVKGPSEPLEDSPITIAVGHLFSIPKRVVHGHELPCVIYLSDVHGRYEGHSVIVQGVSLEHLIVEIISVAGEVISFIHGVVRNAVVAL